MSALEKQEENIFLFYPNLIGYARIVLTIISFYFMPTSWFIAAGCYVFGVLLDAVDGHAARHFNQSTKFGAMLDQLTDRCGTTGLLMTLANFYPKYTFWFQLSIVIDISCHWIYLHSSLLQGKSSHKFIDLSGNPIMSIYYQKGPLFFMCAGNEAFYSALYILHFCEGPLVGGIGLFRLVAYLSFPIAVVKTMISLVHGYVASVNIGLVDVSERQAAKPKNS
ncbi:CDP-diacylglycerol-inositol 3-phosphatidyltransferase [Nesidiocoris tenuis]|uniref:CDP-diacylglycerol--inositol 3-phosphatidyltransferase n=1 Tax=Nesidiocoris tenuis TaxID=355587 RepID=A0ABN7AVX4_9HEMI|nr:CDP-diacylglycerol-inositol 3-phosphatidyltransferase [Nesidiocoris tenuis]